MSGPAPWRDRETLAPLLQAWWLQVQDRELFRTVVGPGWVRLHLAGDERPGLLLTMLPGAVLACPLNGPLPDPLHRALSPTVGEPLGELLRSARLVALALLRDDLVLELTFDTPAGLRRLRHQLFGSRGGLVLLDSDHRMLHTAFPGPHPCLVAPAPGLAGPAAPAPPAALASWNECGLQRLARQRELHLAEALARAAGRAQESAARLVQNLARDLARADGGSERRRDAETLASHLHTVTRGLASVVLADPQDGRPRTIALDPALAPHANLERLFKLARKAERGREVIAARLQTARADCERADALARDLAPLVGGPDAGDADSLERTLARLDRLLAFRRAHPDQLSERRTTGVQAPDEPTRPFRRYRIDGRWEVWVGRSGEENDLLTHRTSHQRDLWLHAQGVPGSHVILRTDGRPDQVPRQVLERAAALAALHSKARHSGLVPVIYTERRYVRKPRKALPGTAVCLQEKNLFVEPKVEAGVVPD
ncbi:MAG: NFACT RNA binding domain-containing protein [Candidatus Krumholzibacteriia bacterium]